VPACNVVQKLPLAAVHGFTKFSPKAKETKLELIYKNKIRERERERLGMNISNNENPWQIPQVANEKTICTSKPSKNTFSHSPSLALTSYNHKSKLQPKHKTDHKIPSAYAPLVLTLANHLINIPCSTWNISP